jgi:hypothetical protein
MQRRGSVVLLLAGIVSVSMFSSEVWGQCGVERWSIKTGTDSGASAIDLTSSSSTTVSSLTSLSAPQPIPVGSRVSPTETTDWTINATLIEFKAENDSDYHLVISDDAGNTMIAEIPSPDCVGASSPFASAIAQARAKFDAAFTPSSSFQHVNVPVQIKGVAMFDFLHGQTGVAPNGIEIHPVMDIIFNPTPPPPVNGFSIAASPTTLGLISGTSVNTAVSTSVVGSFSSDISLAASGLPSGLSASFNPTTIASPGAGSSTLTVAADTSIAAGNYNFTVVGSGGGSTAQSSIAVNICSATSPPSSHVMSRVGAAQLTQRERVLADGSQTHDDDDGHIQIVPSEMARARSHQHGGEVLCAPRQYDIFVGSGWKESSEAREALAQITARLHATAVCKAPAPVQAPVVRERTEGVDRNLSDLKIQALLDSMIASHQLQTPIANAVYVLFLAPNLQSKIGEQHSGRDFLAYHNHFHAKQGEVRYVVVPFDADLGREKRTTARAILNLLNNPDGPVW